MTVGIQALRLVFWARLGSTDIDEQERESVSGDTGLRIVGCAANGTGRLGPPQAVLLTPTSNKARLVGVRHRDRESETGSDPSRRLCALIVTSMRGSAPVCDR